MTNGDSTVPELRATGLAHQIVCWRDALHDGPVPDVPDDELRHIRARFLAGENAADLGTAEEFAERDRILEAHRDGDYVLWFEADLYDQLQLIQIVAKLHELDVPAGRITLICVGEYPGIAHFGGLGELNADQLGRLPAMAAVPLTATALEHATLGLEAVPGSRTRRAGRDRGETPAASCGSWPRPSIGSAANTPPHVTGCH